MTATFYVPSLAQHLIPARGIHQEFRIDVMQPLTRRGDSTRFPVLYVTDGNETFSAAQGIAHALQGAALVNRFIVVGIGYPGENPFAGDLLRARDLTPAYRPPIPEFPSTSPIEGVHQVKSGRKAWGGASEFLAFIRHDLVPFIDAHYPTVKDDRGYFGHSFGGGLGLHDLFSEGPTFNRYIISSPGVAWDGRAHAFEPIERFIASKKPLRVKLFLSVGSEEEFQPGYERSAFCTNFYRLVGLIRRSDIQGLDLVSRLFEGETHASVWPLALSHGVQSVFGKPDRSPIDTPDAQLNGPYGRDACPGTP